MISPSPCPSFLPPPHELLKQQMPRCHAKAFLLDQTESASDSPKQAPSSRCRPVYWLPNEQDKSAAHPPQTSVILVELASCLATLSLNPRLFHVGRRIETEGIAFKDNGIYYPLGFQRKLQCSRLESFQLKSNPSI